MTRIYCCGCQKEIKAKLIYGKDIYPHRKDLAKLPFWKCPACWNFVGCHHKTNNPIKPLGVIPTKEVKEIRKRIHAVLDPMWKDKKIKRTELYKKLSDDLGWNYHTANIRSVEEGEKVLNLLIKYRYFKGYPDNE